MKYYDADTDRLYVGRIVWTVVGVIVLFTVIGWLIWGLGVFTSGVHGRGEQIKQVNSATNRTFQYNHFFDLYGDVKAQTIQISNTKQAIAQTTDPAEVTRLNSVLLGVRNLCAANIQTYNQDAQKVVTGGQFRAHDLPESLPAGSDSSCGDK